MRKELVDTVHVHEKIIALMALHAQEIHALTHAEFSSVCTHREFGYHWLLLRIKI